MKKKVTIFFISMSIIIVTLGITFILLYKSDWAKEKNPKALTTCSFTDILEAKEQQSSFFAIYVYEDDFVDFAFDVQEIKGSVDVTIYGGYVDSTDNMEFQKIINPDCELMRFQLTETGRKRYSFSGENVTCYVLCVELTAGAEYAEIDNTVYSWNSNWTNLMCKLGLEKSTAIDVDTIKTGLVGK